MAYATVLTGKMLAHVVKIKLQKDLQKLLRKLCGNYYEGYSYVNKEKNGARCR